MVWACLPILFASIAVFRTVLLRNAAQGARRQLEHATLARRAANERFHLMICKSETRGGH